MSYSYDILKKNLQRLMKERSLRTVDLESKTNKKRVVHNILSGTSTNPSINTMKSLADALNIDIEDLLRDTDIEKKLDPDLFLDVCIKVVNEINPLIDKYNIKINNVVTIIKDVYNYAYGVNPPKADEQFIKWVIKQKYN
jgi:transcriptional regulator with XRE-family HTH domain